MITSVSIAAKSILGLVIIKENKTIDKPKKMTRSITLVRKSLNPKFKISD
jgi:hypothetical protein